MGNPFIDITDLFLMISENGPFRNLVYCHIFYTKLSNFIIILNYLLIIYYYILINIQLCYSTHNCVYFYNCLVKVYLFVILEN